MKRLVILISGRGSNMEAIVKACAAEGWPAEVAAVISNRPDAGGLQFAAGHGFATAVVDHKAYASREAFEDALLAELADAGVEAVVLAGFMRVLTSRFIGAYPQRIVNTHPALLPAFPGVDAAGQALAHGCKLTGVTVHFVDTGVDTGPIIAQRAVPIVPDDTVETLQHRIQIEEHRLLPAVVQALAAGRLTCEGRRVAIARDRHADELL